MMNLSESLNLIANGVDETIESGTLVRALPCGCVISSVVPCQWQTDSQCNDCSKREREGLDRRSRFFRSLADCLDAQSRFSDKPIRAERRSGTRSMDSAPADVVRELQQAIESSTDHMDPSQALVCNPPIPQWLIARLESIA